MPISTVLPYHGHAQAVQLNSPSSMSMAGRSLHLLRFTIISVATAVSLHALTSSSSLPHLLPVEPRANLRGHRRGWDAALLEPLDAGLRAEILRYGDLAQATYDAFDRRHWSPNCGTCLHGLRRMLPALGLAGHGYVVTSFIYATCDVDIPRWLMSRLHADAWDDHANWAGYVAVAGAEEAGRAGHRDVVVVWRGTMAAEEWFMNLKTSLVPFDAAEHDDVAMVAKGFHALYTSSNAGNKFGARSARDQVADELKRAVQYFREQRGEEVRITVTGHSLGGALALLSARDAAAAHPDVPVRAVTFSAPRVGNKAFCDGLTSRGVDVLRVVVKTDLVPTVPQTALAATVPGVLGGVWALVGRGEYVHVGDKLLLDVAKSPHLKEDQDRVGSHNLELCLHLLDGHETAAGAFRKDDGGAPRRDVALVNKRSAMLHDKERIPEKWCQMANKGLGRDLSGRWALPERERDDVPANDLLPLSELD